MGNESERVMIFIDGNNFYHGLKNDIGDTDIDFQKFVNILADNRKLVNVFYYNAPLDRRMDPQRYKTTLSDVRHSAKFKVLRS